jgi:hypothetical protein
MGHFVPQIMLGANYFAPSMTVLAGAAFFAEQAFGARQRILAILPNR